MRIFIEPLEPLQFRTGRPFTAGEHNFAESIFPPTPETLQGALRAAIAVYWGEARTPPLRDLNTIFQQQELTRLIGDRSSYGRMQITGLTLGRWDEQRTRVERLFPAPANFLRVKNKGEQREKIVRLLPVMDEQKSGMTNMPGACPLLLPPEKLDLSQKADELSGWLTWRGLQAVLHGAELSEDENTVLKAEQVYTRESRLGIGMDSARKTTKEGFLYQAISTRIRERYGFVIDLQLAPKDDQASPLDVPAELNFLHEGWMTLGGEQRAARFTVLQADQVEVEESAQLSVESKKFLYLVTPAFLKNGWLPENTSLTEGLVTAAVNRYQTIGGWALEPGNAGGAAKKTQRCVPAGSIYFFDRNIPHKAPFTEYGAQIGYGLTYTGTWNYYVGEQNA